MYRYPKRRSRLISAFAAVLLFFAALSGWANAADAAPVNAEKLGIGQPAAAAEIAGWDIDIRFDGTGLPPGSGDAETGEVLFEAKCASCHGDFGQGEGRWPPLSGGFDSLLLQGSAGRPEKTIGSYWPYSPILFDYIRRAMPYTAPQSLSDDETYALSAFVLYLNDIVEDDFIANADSLTAINMPNRDNFFDDPRPDVHNTACMQNCLNAEELMLIESIEGITPLRDDNAPTTETPPTASAAPAASNKSVNENGKKIYMRACAVCHATGVAQAPITGADGKKDWQERLAVVGMDSLVNSALNGKGAMPPQKVIGLSAAEVKDAIQHMLELSNVDY